MTPEPQPIDTPLTRSAVFLVVSVKDAAPVREVLGDLDGLVKTVSFRDLRESLVCIAAIGARVWTDIMGTPPPAELHDFRPVVGETHTAPATDGDILFHIRADSADLCFEFERLLLASLGGAVAVVDETVGFRYFDARDLLGFVDGTANPVGRTLPHVTIVGDEDAAHAGGAYVVTQKYLHDLERWQGMTTEDQQAVIGRTKVDNVELPDAESGQKSHKTLNTIEDDAGEHDILRDNMPFGRPAAGEFGTYFIGYTRRLWVIERMLQRMFLGDPPGLYDRILDVSTPVTGSVFFAPSADALAALGD